jgi:Ca-activated chloride channel homolog
VAAATAFVETSNSQDEIFALTFSGAVRAALPPGAPFSGDPATIGGALRRAMSAQGRTALYDAVLAGLDYAERGHRQRRVLVVVADGGDNASATGFDELLQRAEASQTLIYTIAIADPIDRESNPGRLERIARAAGGEPFRPRTPGEIAGVLRHIAADIRSMYTLGYAPAEPPVRVTTGFRRVRVTAHAPGHDRLHVHTRPGYRVEEGRR